MSTDGLKFFDPRDPDIGFLCNFFRSPFLLDDRLYPTYLQWWPIFQKLLAVGKA